MKRKSLKWLECVPNFSEGRDREKLEKIAGAIRAVPEAYLLGYEADGDHNRAVFTLVGPLRAVLEGAFQAVKMASLVLDLQNHQGVHPRLGVADVIPLIPLWESTMEEAREGALTLGQRIGEELAIPVYLYGETARRQDRYHLSDLRRGGTPVLAGEIHSNPDKKPDFGPSKLHPTAGASCIGARDFLVAYNILLKTRDLKVAKKIAREIRKRETVKSLGFPLESLKKVQVSMNLVDFRKNSIPEVYEAVEALAREGNTEIEESELIGLLPTEVLLRDFRTKYRVTNLEEGKVLEPALLNQLISTPSPFRLDPYLADLCAPSSTPGGGSAAATSASIGMALLKMAWNLGQKKKIPPEDQPRMDNLGALISQRIWDLRTLAWEDSQAYHQAVEASKKAKEDPSRVREKEEAFQKAARIPLSLMEILIETLEEIPFFLGHCKKGLLPDGRTARYILKGAFEGASEMVKCNLPYLSERDSIEKAFESLLDRFHALEK